jgi:hypothetical protein
MKKIVKVKIRNEIHEAETFKDGKYYFKGYIVNEEHQRLHHRVVSEMVDGKCPAGYHVHHCDFSKLNNLPENLVQIPSELHEIIHKHYTYKPTKKEILEKILPQYLENKSKETNRYRQAEADILMKALEITSLIKSHPRSKQVYTKFIARMKQLNKRK